MDEEIRESVFEMLCEEFCFYLLESGEVELFFSIVEFVRKKVKSGVKLNGEQVRFCLGINKKKRFFDESMSKKVNFFIKNQLEYYYL